MSKEGCAEFRELAPELALGTLDGEERATALAHLGECADCRRLLDELATTADQLLLLAPEAEPPAGFEGRTLARVKPEPERRPLFGRRFGMPAFAAAAGALAAAVLVFGVTREDHRLADDYRAALETADGEEFAATPISSNAGAEAGQFFTYEGDPSWVMVVIDGADGLEDGTYECRITLANGSKLKIGDVTLEDGTGSWGKAFEGDVEQAEEMQLVSSKGDPVLVAEL